MGATQEPDGQSGTSASERPDAASPTATRQKLPSTAALRAAFPLTLPILAGFLLTGATCGIYASSLGLPWYAPTLMAVVIFAGSAEFVVASMLVAPFDPLATFATIFAVNARHLFYGLSMLERYAPLRHRGYLIYAMCDETFSINFAAEPPEGVEASDFHFWVSLLNQLYWVVGCTAGGIFGSALAVDVPGISFAMTALFVVIFLDQWLKDKSHISAVAGVALSCVALALFGADGFMLGALALILVAVTALRRWIEPAYELDGAQAGGAGATRVAAPTHAGDTAHTGAVETPVQACTAKEANPQAFGAEAPMPHDDGRPKTAAATPMSGGER